MYISCLLIDTGTDPDRPRPGRLWLRNVYHVHQRLCMAFPSNPRKADDPDFLNPYDPKDFETGHVHVARKQGAGFLFRIDPLSGGRAAILVQSAKEPDWEYAFHNARYILAAPAEIKPFDPSFIEGQRLRFLLAANPTRRLSKNSTGADGQPVKEKWIGKRVPVPSGRLVEWLSGRARQGGFSIEENSTTCQTTYVYFKKPGKSRDDKPGGEQKDEQSRLRSARFEGRLEVADPAIFKKTLVSGIGPGKAFGFGLLSVLALSNHD